MTTKGRVVQQSATLEPDHTEAPPRSTRRTDSILRWLWAGDELRFADLIRQTPVTFTIAGLGVTLFVAESATNTTQEMLYRLGGHMGRMLEHGEWWRLFTVALTDPATWGPWHPLSLANTIALVAIGPRIERQVGSRWFPIVYLTSHFVTATSMVLFLPDYPDYAAGSSGGVGGIYGALVALALIRVARARDLRRLPWGVPLSLAAISTFSATSAPPISNVGHIAAIGSGAILGAALSAHPTRRTQASLIATAAMGLAGVASVVYRVLTH